MEQLSYIIWGITAFMAFVLLLRFLRTGSLAGTVFRAPISQTIGEVAVKRSGVTHVTKIHVLESDDETRAVGVEIVSGCVPNAVEKEKRSSAHRDVIRSSCRLAACKKLVKVLISDDASKLDVSCGDETEEQRDRGFLGGKRRLGFRATSELPIEVFNSVGRS